jgi:hypothetical protein
MATIASTTVIAPKTLSPAERVKFIETLYGVHSQIFEGVDKESFVKYVVDSTAEHTWIELQKNAQGQVVGYIAAHIFERALRGKKTAILRAEAGLLRDYRGSGASPRFGVKLLVRYMAAHPGRPIYYLGSLVHPSSYAVLEKYAGEVWPSPAADLPADIASFMTELASEFGLDRVGEANPLIRKVGWQTRDSGKDRAYWLQCDKPAARFFVQVNPGYGQGHGLLTLVPVTFSTVARAAGVSIRERGKRWAQKSVARLRDAFGGPSLRRGYSPASACATACSGELQPRTRRSQAERSSNKV